MKENKAHTWVKMQPGMVAASDSTLALEAGIYKLREDGPNTFLAKMEDSGDELCSWEGSSVHRILEAIKYFWTRENHFRRMGVAWKRGILLWGPPGGGKTSVVRAVAQWTVANGGLAIMSSRVDLIINALHMVRHVEPKRPIVVMMEELDQMGNLAPLASLLDGEYQVDNVVFVATTNYPERLDSKLTNRPSRFDVIEYVGMPDETARRTFLKSRLGDFDHTDEQIIQWAKDTDGMSLAHVKELIIATYVLELPYEQVLQRLRDMMEGKAITDPTKKDVGFKGTKDDDDDDDEEVEEGTEFTIKIEPGFTMPQLLSQYCTPLVAPPEPASNGGGS